MDPSWRNQYLDSYQQPIKFTWWIMGGNIYRDADNLNVPVANTMVLYLMKKYHGSSINQLEDEVSLHYHTFYWSDYDLDGIYHWNQSRTFNECKEDWDVTLAQYLLEEDVFPASLRSGWHFMDENWQQTLNGLIPYCFHDDYGALRAWYTNEPIAGVEDWTKAPSSFIPFHPSTNDYQIPGESPGWNVRSIKMQNLTQADVNYMFSQASNGVDQVACLWSHLPENYLAMIAKTASFLQKATEAYPKVPFRYCTAVEAMQRWQGITNQTPPNLTIQETEKDQTVTLIISTDKTIFQAKPFVAVRDAFRRYFNVSSLCTPTGTNSWSIALPIPRPILAKVAVAVTDVYGNRATQIRRYLPDDVYIDNLDAEYSEVAGSWVTTTNAAWGTDARVALLSSNKTAQVRWLLPITNSGTYSIAAQVPPLTNGCTNVTFRLLAGGSNVCSTGFPDGLRTNQWNFVCAAFLDQNLTNVLEMVVDGTNQPGTFAAADVVSIIPTVSSPGLPAQDQISISPTAQGVLVQFTGQPGTKCQVQRSTSLGTWTTLEELAVPLTSLLEYEDRNAPQATAFYRITELSPKP
jgi:hypothetical protein